MMMEALLNGKFVSTKVSDMNELILVIAVIAALFAINFFVRRTRQPLLSYIKILACVGLLLIVWLFKTDSSIIPKMVLSFIAAVGIVKSFFTLIKSGTAK